MSVADVAQYARKDVLITGGLGFIGSTLALRLVRLGARVTVVDNFLADHGANWFNIAEIRDDPALHVNLCDICDKASMNELCRGKEIVFHLAGQVSHVLSLQNPFPDIEINVTGTAVLLETLKRHQSKARLVYTGTRGQYGRQTKLPVHEDATPNPKGIYELSNHTAEKMIQIYNEIHGIPSVLLRLTNIYGPRAQVKHPHYGVLNWFVRLAVEGREIPLMGGGNSLRDFVYIDDCVNALLAAGIAPEVDRGEAINVGSDQPFTFLQAAEMLHQICGVPYKFVEFSKERAVQEPGDFYSDISKARRLLGWEPTTSLRDGLLRYYEWLRENRAHYLT